MDHYRKSFLKKKKIQRGFVARLLCMLGILAITFISLEIAIYSFVSGGGARYVIDHRRLVDLTALDGFSSYISGADVSASVSASDSALPAQDDRKDSISDFFSDVFAVSSIMLRGGKVIYLEAGTVPDAASLSSVTGIDVVPITPLDSVRTDDIGYYKTVMQCRGLPTPCLLVITDSTAPVCSNEEKWLWLGEPLPVPEAFASAFDNTQIECRYVKAPDLTKAGTTGVSIEITDRGGNITMCNLLCEVIADTEPPVIHGAADRTVYIGSDVTYKSGVTADDNRDGANLPVNVDISAVNPEKEGVYPVTYSVSDSSGLTASVTVNFTFEFTKEDEIKNKVNELITPILNSILKDGMTDRQKANAIYNWVRYNIHYVGTSQKNSWYEGAYDGMTHRSGDCYTYFSVSKAMLNYVGIENIDVTREYTPKRPNRHHYWNMVKVEGNWYHFDASPRNDGARFCLVTTDTLLKYSKTHTDSHLFDPSKYPATP